MLKNKLNIMHSLLQETFQSMGVLDEMTSPSVIRILEIARPYSMVHDTGIIFAMGSVIYAIKNGQKGHIVECGVWKGGCALAMLLIQREIYGQIIKPVHMLDSFDGLPPVDDRDGPLAAQWQSGANQETFYENCKADVTELRNTLIQHGLSVSDYYIVQGWFDNTIPNVAEQLSIEGIAVLRLDSDWYASTKLCLEYFCKLTQEEGVVILDDYYAWDGCAKATHDYFTNYDLPYRIKSLPYNFGAYFIKRLYRDKLSKF
jgi:O-methyltransferase